MKERQCCPPRGHMAIYGDNFQLSQLRECYRDASKHPAIHKTAPKTIVIQPQTSIVQRLRNPVLG